MSHVHTEKSGEHADTKHVVTTDVTLLPQARAAAGVVVLDQVVAADQIVLPDEPWDLSARGLVLSGALPDDAARARALQAAARGVRLAVAVEPARVESFVADLRAKAGGDVVVVDQPKQTLAALTEDQRSLLALLAAGWTVPDAARQLYLSLRTAERRLAGARKALGVSTTAEAVALLNRAGAGVRPG